MNHDFKEQAFALAADLDCEIYTYGCPANPYTVWRCGQRSSADQYCKTFPDRFSAAIHFLTTEEARSALKQREKKARAIMDECEERKPL